jgi:hypothetical protein
MAASSKHRCGRVLHGPLVFRQFGDGKCDRNVALLNELPAQLTRLTRGTEVALQVWSPPPLTRFGEPS